MSVLAFSRSAATYAQAASLQQSLVHALAEELSLVMPAQAGIQAEAKTIIVDAGCGTGFFAQWCASHRKGWRVIGADAAFGMCKAAPGAVVQADMQLLPIATAATDAMFCASSLQWVTDWDAAFAEFSRVLKPGGWLAASVFVRGTLQELERAFDVVDGYSHLLTFRPPEALFDAARAAGFAVTAYHHHSHAERVTGAAALMRQIKALGANGKSGNLRKGMMTPRQLTTLEDAYRRISPDMKASWSIASLIARKESA